MPSKKDVPVESPKDSELEQRVNVIMGEATSEPASKQSEPRATVKASKASQAKPVSVFTDLKTAPEVPKHLLEQLQEPQEDQSPIASKMSVKQPKQIATQLSTASKVDTPKTALAESDVAVSLPEALIQDGEALLSDAATDKAVDDIVTHEGDVVLAAEDAIRDRANGAVPAKTKRQKLGAILKNKWLLASVLVVLAAVFGLPWTRYRVLGLALHKTVQISVVDSVTGVPVSEAHVVLDGKQMQTSASGKVSLKVPVGPSTIIVSKAYYKSDTQNVFVSLSSGVSASIRLIATGRQVPITVINTITGKPVAGVTVRALGTSAKTDSKGLAIIVLPTKNISDAATIAADNYNTTTSTITVTANAIPANTLKITPAGQVYFLSNLSGTLDVVKANLDGTGRKTVLAGTGKENANQTSLLATQDWRYLVLTASRDSAQPALYLIDTSTDKVTEFDSGNATFTPIGWYGHSFVYDVVHDTANAWQSGRETLKSYDADNGAINQLDASQADGSSASYGTQTFGGFVITDSQVLYTVQWYSYDSTGGGYDLSSKTSSIRGVQLVTHAKKDYQTFPANSYSYISDNWLSPGVIEYQSYDYPDNKTLYYQYNTGSVTVDPTGNSSAFQKTNPTYLVSPSETQTFWSEQRDGKNSLFVGDANGKNPTQIASLSDYSAYGWYGTYLLVSKGGSELYVMPNGIATANQQPIKISDYYRPSGSNVLTDGNTYGGL